METAEHEADQRRVRASIRERYTLAARKVLHWTEAPNLRSDTLGLDDELLETGSEFGSSLYSARDLNLLPRPAVSASLGCGSPTKDAPLMEGDAVLDVGCGGGIDVILAAAAVGIRGRVFGLDLSGAMIELARQNSRASGNSIASFVVGQMEDLPLRAATIDLVISNAAIHLSVDKPRAFAELFRVLTPSGRLHVIDIVAADSLSVFERGERVCSTNTTAGILSLAEYGTALEVAGFAGRRPAPKACLSGPSDGRAGDRGQAIILLGGPGYCARAMSAS